MAITSIRNRVLSIILIICLIFGISGTEAVAASYSVTVKNVTAPEEITAGNIFKIKGTVQSTYTIKSVKIGICDESGKWLSGHYTTKKPEKKSYFISNANSKLNFNTLEKGTYYLKVYVTDSKNHKKTALKSKFTVKAASSFKINSLEVPKELTESDSFDISGKVQSTYNIKSIKIGICDSDGKWLSGHYTTKKPEKKSYSVSNANSKLNFNTLKQGTYYLTIHVTDSNGAEETILQHEFTIGKRLSEFTVYDYTYPVSIKEGDSFSIKGIVKSEYNMTRVRVGIWNDDTKKWYSGMMTEFVPDSKIFDISLADNDIKFGKLTAGTYYYRVYVTDSEGVSKSVIKKKFTVSDIESKLTVSDDKTYPSVMTEGSSFALTGTVESAVLLDYVIVGICDTDGNRLAEFNKTVKNIGRKTFNISTVDSDISFGGLSPGQYRYKVYAKDMNGTGKTLINKKFTVISKFTVNTTTTGSNITREMYDAINAGGVFFAQEPRREGCTVVAAAMMARRKAIMSGVSEDAWSLLTEWNLRADRNVWIYNGGLKSSNVTILGMSIAQVRFADDATVAAKKKKLISLLEKHPEGIVVYSKYGGRAHAALLTDYIEDTFYVVDPVSGKKVTMADSTLYGAKATQASRLSALHSYWYIKGGN